MTSDNPLTAAGFSLTERLAVASLLRQLGDRRLFKRLQKRACSCDGKVTWLPGILPFSQLLPVLRVGSGAAPSGVDTAAKDGSGLLVRPFPQIYTAFLHQSRLLTSLELFEGQSTFRDRHKGDLADSMALEVLESRLPHGAELLILDSKSPAGDSLWFLRHQVVRHFLSETELRSRHRLSGAFVRLTVLLPTEAAIHDPKSLDLLETEDLFRPARPWHSSGFRYLPVSRGCSARQKRLDWSTAILFEANSADFDKVSALPARDQTDTW